MYLGILLGANPNKLATWEQVITRIQQKLAGWKAKLLSRAGRLVLIKSVLNSIPLYYMSIYKISKGVVKKMIQLQCQFFWQVRGNGINLSLIKWLIIQKSKIFGGLGIEDHTIKNTGLLFKWWWRFSEEGNILRKRTIYSIHNLNLDLAIIN